MSQTKTWHAARIVGLWAWQAPEAGAAVC